MSSVSATQEPQCTSALRGARGLRPRRPSSQLGTPGRVAGAEVLVGEPSNHRRTVPDGRKAIGIPGDAPTQHPG